MIVNAEATDEELFDHEMRAECEQADRDERTKHIQVKYEHGHGTDELVRDYTVQDRIRLIWCPF